MVVNSAQAPSFKRRSQHRSDRGCIRDTLFTYVTYFYCNMTHKSFFYLTAQSTGNTVWLSGGLTFTSGSTVQFRIVRTPIGQLSKTMPNRGDRDMSEEKLLLRMSNIQKDFYGNRILEDINISLKHGEILGLVGENGAGKSTLMNILFGMPIIQATGGYGGSIFVDGVKTNFKNPVDAIDAGIGMVHQEFFLIPSFSATENILLNREATRYNPLVEVFGDRLRSLDRQAMRARAERAISALGVTIDPDTLVSEMPVSYKQFTEIAREIDRTRMKILVVDEPTAVLTESEAGVFLSALKRLAAKGIGMIFISHRLHEIFELCNRIVVLRDGKVVKDTPTAETDVPSVASWMMGHEMKDSTRRRARAQRDALPILTIEKLRVTMPGEKVRNVSLEVRKGEILGIGGLAGQGKLGIANGIMGLYPAGGDVTLDGKRIALNAPLESIRAGFAFISEDRRGIGLLLGESIALNIAFAAMQVQGKFLRRILGFIKWSDKPRLRSSAKEYIDHLMIKCTGPDQRVAELSGGNQQKVCVAKVLAMSPKVLFASEPTRGIDIGAKRLVLDVLKDFNERYGTTIIVTSSELEELRELCDRIAIISEGEVAGILPSDTPSEEFGLLMMGESKQAGGATHV